MSALLALFRLIYRALHISYQMLNITLMITFWKSEGQGRTTTLKQATLDPPTSNLASFWHFFVFLCMFYALFILGFSEIFFQCSCIFLKCFFSPNNSTFVPLLLTCYALLYTFSFFVCAFLHQFCALFASK